VKDAALMAIGGQKKGWSFAYRETPDPDIFPVFPVSVLPN
jgi:hypothetical protein